MKASRMTAWPSIETLAERCKWDERTVKRWRKSLEEKGFLSVTRTPGKPPTYQFKKSGFGVFHALESVEPKAENGGSKICLWRGYKICLWRGYKICPPK